MFSPAWAIPDPEHQRESDKNIRKHNAKERQEFSPCSVKPKEAIGEKQLLFFDLIGVWVGIGQLQGQTSPLMHVSL